ncbi:MAG: hypothetical protein EBY89_00845, partial [Actinobacteria bacterium]|nr:hypothetical protein [Actinomycetota bacterium]
QVPLLSAEEEKDLGKKIKAGLVAQAQLNSSDNNQSFAERRKLQRTAKEGEGSGRKATNENAAARHVCRQDFLEGLII